MEDRIILKKQLVEDYKALVEKAFPTIEVVKGSLADRVRNTVNQDYQQIEAIRVYNQGLIPIADQLTLQIAESVKKEVEPLGLKVRVTNSKKVVDNVRYVIIYIEDKPSNSANVTISLRVSYTNIGVINGNVRKYSIDSSSVTLSTYHSRQCVVRINKLLNDPIFEQGIIYLYKKLTEAKSEDE